MIINLSANRKIKQNLTLLFIILCLSMYSCKKKNEDSSTMDYYYEILDGEQNVKGYFKRIIFTNGEKRIDSVFRFDKNKILRNSRVEDIVLNSEGVKINNEYTYNISIKDSCYKSRNLLNDEEVEICYLGLNNLTLNDTSLDAFKFQISDLEIDGVIRDRYFDKKFILIKEEFKEGLLDYYKIIRVNNVDGLN